MSVIARILSSKVEWIARYGYLAKGLVYCSLGILVFLAALGIAEGRVTGTGGVIEVVAGPAAGQILLALLVVGLGAHVFWRVYQAIVDPSEKGRGLKALAQRAGYVFSALAYLSLTSAALAQLTFLWQDRSGSSKESTAASVLEAPGGRAVLGMIGLVVTGVGIYHASRAWSQSFKKKWMPEYSSRRMLSVLAGSASVGIAARAILFLVIGWQLLQAGWLSDSSEVVDVASALWQISSERLGTWLLGLMGLGLFLYGSYCVTNARLRRI